MKESVTYQAIVEEGRVEGLAKGLARGRVEEARSLLMRRGNRALGPPDASIRSRLESIDDVEVLEGLTDRMLDGEFKSWAELLPPGA